MANKGTQALLASDVRQLRDTIKGKIVFGVSTTDIDGTQRLNLNLETVLPPLIDILYERTDSLARKYGFSRESLTYKVFSALGPLIMFSQMLLCVVSCFLVKIRLQPLYRAKIFQNMKNCKVVICCSDENFKESVSCLPLKPAWLAAWWSMLISRTMMIVTAKFFRKPVIVFPNSVGPFRTVMGRSLSKFALGLCDYVMVRDSSSYKMLESMKVRSPKTLTSDITLLFENDMLVANYDGSSGVLGVSPGLYSHTLSEKEIYFYIDSHAKALDRMIEKHNCRVDFLPHYLTGFKNDDYEISKLILNRMKYSEKARIIKVLNARDFKALLGRMTMVISSKLHPAILASSVHVPTLAIAYDQKQIEFFNGLGLSECVISLGDFSENKLSSKIELIWNKRDEISDLIKARIPVLQERLRGSIKDVLSLYVETKAIHISAE